MSSQSTKEESRFESTHQRINALNGSLTCVELGFDRFIKTMPLRD